MSFTYWRGRARLIAPVAAGVVVAALLINANIGSSRSKPVVPLGPAALQQAAFTGGGVKVFLSFPKLFPAGGPVVSDVPIQSFSVGVKQAVNAVGGGAGAGKVVFNDATLDRAIDKYSTLFLKAAETGPHGDATVHVERVAGTPPRTVESLTFALKLALVTEDSYTVDQTGKEKITIAYGGLQVTYK